MYEQKYTMSCVCVFFLLCSLSCNVLGHRILEVLNYGVKMFATILSKRQEAIYNDIYYIFFFHFFYFSF